MTHDRDTLLERELRDTFHGMADTFEPSPMPRNLWDRGRTTRRTDRVRVLAAVAVVIALLGGLVVFQQTSGALLPATTSESGALPKHLYVPSDEHLTKLTADGQHPTSPDDVGRASIATLTTAGHPLLISATTGEHHLLHIPDLALVHSMDGLVLPLALSPDGWKLAYSYQVPFSADEPEESGIGVIDLRGEMADVMLPLTAPDRAPIEINDIAWSPDSSHLAWLGSTYVPGEGPTDEDTKWLGSGDAGLGGMRQWSLESKSWPNKIVVDDRGRGFVIGDEAWPFGEDPDLSAISPSSGRAFSVDEEWFSMNDRGAALTADGRTLLLGVPSPTGSARGSTFTHLEVDLDSPDLTSTRTDWAMDPDKGGHYLQVLGGTPDGSVVATQNFAASSVEAVSPDGAFRRLTTVHGFPSASLTVATDLADADPVRFATPPWAPRPPLWPLLVGVLLVFGALRIVLRRQRLRRSPDVADAVVNSVNPAPSHAVRSAERVEPPTGRAVVAWGLILLVLLGALAHVSRPWPTGESVRSADGAVPTTIHLPPDHLTQSTYDVEPSDLDVGRTSALLQANNRPAILVSAEDGRHRVVFLAGQHSGMGSSTDTPTLLSPDGNRLAWTYADADPDEFVETVKGVRIADLITGEVEDVRLTAKDGGAIRIHEVTWSPSGAHLAWLGSKPVRKKTKGGHPQQAGVVTLSSSGEESAVTAPWELPTSSSSRETIAVDDAGTARVLAGRRLWTLPAPSRGATPTSRRVTDHGQIWTGAAVSPDGRHLVTGLNHSSDSNPYASGLMTLDLTSTDSQMVTHPWRDLPLDAGTRALGWTPEGDAVVSHHVRDLNQQSSAEQVSVVTEFGRATPLTGVDTNYLTVSMATDLASNPIEFPEPVWPRSDERKWALGLLGVAALGAALKLVGALRRRRTSEVAPHM